MENNKNNSWLRGSCIGRGAYGTVNAAVNTTTGDVFAVKSVDIATASPSQVEALENEIRILRSLSSPFIVKYLGDDTTAEGSPAASFRNLHMEYLPAGTAADVADPDVASYAWCLVSALRYLHSRGIVHCDVKGRNVLLGPSPGSAKLADLGSAVEMSSAALSGRGSPLWMAPEVIRGEHQGPESDVWSVGCTVIEMVTGKPAWGASVCRIGYSEEVPLFPARLSSSGADFLEKCLRRDYTRRWSCDQLLRHPFLTMSSHKDTDIIADYWSPRCVLDCFNSEFHEEEEEEEEEEEGGDADIDTIRNVDGNDRIRGLVSGAGTGRGANWESDGWVVVRGQSQSDGGGGTFSEYSAFIEDRTSLGASSRYDDAPTHSINSNIPDYQSTCTNTIVNTRHYQTSNSNSKMNVAPQCTQTQVIGRSFKFSNYKFVYDHLHIF